MTDPRACIALGIAAVAAAACSKQDAEPSPSSDGTSSPSDPVLREPTLASLKSRLGAARAEPRSLPVGALLLALATGCRSTAEPSPPMANDVPVRASWHLPGAGFLTDVGLSSPADDGLQAAVLNAQDAALLRRALAKWHHPTLQVPSSAALLDDLFRYPPEFGEYGSGSIAPILTWRIPVGWDQTVVTMAVRHVDEIFEVDLLCDGERMQRRVLPAHCLLVHGLPTNAALLCLFEFDRAP